MLPLTAQVLIRLRRIAIGCSRPLRIGQIVEYRPIKFMDPPLLRLCHFSRGPKLIQRTTGLPCTSLSQQQPHLFQFRFHLIIPSSVHCSACILKYASSGGQPIRKGNQLPLPLWT